MSVTIEMKFVCDLKVAALVEEVLEGTGIVADVRTVSTDEKSSIRGANGKRFRNGIRLKGIIGIDLVRKILGDRRTASPTLLNAAFRDAGFAKGSYSPTMSRAVKDGIAVRNPNGTYSLAKAPKVDDDDE